MDRLFRISEVRSNPGNSRERMHAVEWLAWSGFVCFWLLYIMALVTLGVITFRKGRWVLGVIGLFFPLLWVVGALLPARPGSAADIEQRDYYWWG